MSEIDAVKHWLRPSNWSGFELGRAQETLTVISELEAENERLWQRLLSVVRTLRHIGEVHHYPDDGECHDPHILDCSLAGRVSHVFGIGMTSAIELCRDAGCDPDWTDPRAKGGDDDE